MSGLIRFRGARYRVVTAAKLTMWHGTSTGPDGEILRSILKQGLIPDPKAKAYRSPYSDDGYQEIDFDTEETMELDESLGGAYLTNMVGEAIRYSKHAVQVHGGGHVLVAAQIETQDTEVKIDEDFLINYIWEFITRPFEAVNDEVYEAELLKWLEQGADYEKIGRAWIAQQFSHVKVPEAQMAKVMPHLVKAVRSIAILTFFQSNWDRLHAIAYDATRDPEAAEALEAVDLGYDIMDIDEIEERQRARQDYKEAIRQVSDLLTAVTAPPTKGSQHNIRILKPVGYRGANRILAVASWDRPTESGYGVDRTAMLHYGQDSVVVDQMIKAIGASRQWVDARDPRGKAKQLPVQRGVAARIAEAPAETYGATVYHGSNNPDLAHLKALWPQYEGGIGGGVYVDFDRRVAEQYGHTIYQLKLLLKPEEIFWLEPNTIPGLEGHSLLSGEQVEPFWFECGGEYYVVTNEMFDDHVVPADEDDGPMSLDDLGDQIGLEDIGEVAERHGYKAVYVEGIRPLSELLVFDPQDVQMIGPVE